MKVNVRAIKDFISPAFGNIDKGMVFALEKDVAPSWVDAGLVEYEDKVNSIKNVDEIADKTSDKAKSARRKK